MVSQPRWKVSGDKKNSSMFYLQHGPVNDFCVVEQHCSVCKSNCCGQVFKAANHTATYHLRVYPMAAFYNAGLNPLDM